MGRLLTLPLQTMMRIEVRWEMSDSRPKISMKKHTIKLVHLVPIPINTILRLCITDEAGSMYSHKV